MCNVAHITYELSVDSSPLKMWSDGPKKADESEPTNPVMTEFKTTSVMYTRLEQSVRTVDVS
jgi:hypothetical protein